MPALGISVSAEYDVKLQGIFSMFEANEFLFSAAELNIERILRSLRKIFYNRSGIIS